MIELIELNKLSELNKLIKFKVECVDSKLFSFIAQNCSGAKNAEIEFKLDNNFVCRVRHFVLRPFNGEQNFTNLCTLGVSSEAGGEH